MSPLTALFIWYPLLYCLVPVLGQLDKRTSQNSGQHVVIGRSFVKSFACFPFHAYGAHTTSTGTYLR